MNKNMRHSTRLQGNQNQGPGMDRVFGENVPNPVDIEWNAHEDDQKH